jgi:hypothetical protein
MNGGRFSVAICETLWLLAALIAICTGGTDGSSKQTQGQADLGMKKPATGLIYCQQARDGCSRIVPEDLKRA